MTDIRYQEWRGENEPTKFPFSDIATLLDDNGVVLGADTFLDASFYPVGGAANGYLSRIVVSSTTVTLYVGDDVDQERASGSFAIEAPPDAIEFTDAYGRPAGLIVSESARLALFQSWSSGEYHFTWDQTALVANCWLPTPEAGVRGFLLDDGSVLTGDVYLLGDDGVVLSCESVRVPGTCEVAEHTDYLIRVDIVGDPLWKRKACAPGFFATPRFLERITFQQGSRTFVCGPGVNGNIHIAAVSRQTPDSILRVRPTDLGIRIEAVGEGIQSAQ